jgi:hypothetical protein
MAAQIRIVPLVLIVLASACSDEFVGPTNAELEELCGQNEPLRILALDPDEQPESVRALPFDDRYLVQLSNRRDGKGYVSDIWSVGQCGAEPFLLASAVDYNLKQYDPYPDVMFACRDADRALLALDPTGAHAASPAFATLNCFAVPTPAGLVTILGDDADAETGTLVLQPWPDDPFAQSAEQIVLLDDVKAKAVPNPYIWSDMDDVLDASDDEVFAVTAADELVAVSLTDFGTTVLAAGVREFEHSADRRWFVWQGVELTSAESEPPAGPMMLLDRSTQTVTELGEGILQYADDPFLLASQGVLFFLDPAGDTHYLDLASMEPLTVLSEYTPMRIIDDGRVLLGVVERPPYILADLSTWETTVLYDGDRRALHFDDEGFVVFSGVYGVEIDEVVHIPYSGAPKPLAEHAIGGFEVASDHRVVTPYAVDSENIGQLIVVNPETLDEKYLAEDVLSTSASIHEPTPGEMIVSYLVVDEDPARHGVWVAKPAK